MLGTKTGGRVAGTPNKRTLDIQQRLEELGCDPIKGMATIAMNEDNPPELRGRMYSELAQYVAPKRKPATELDGANRAIMAYLESWQSRCNSGV